MCINNSHLIFPDFSPIRRNDITWPLSETSSSFSSAVTMTHSFKWHTNYWDLQQTLPLLFCLVILPLAGSPPASIVLLVLENLILAVHAVCWEISPSSPAPCAEKSCPVCPRPVMKITLFAVPGHAGLAKRLPAGHGLRNVHRNAQPLLRGHDVSDGVWVSPVVSQRWRLDRCRSGHHWVARR